MMKKKILLFLLMILSATVSFSQNYTAAQVRQRINKTASKIHTLRCDFVQTRTQKMLKNKAVAYGNMYYGKPNKLKWEYTSPTQYTFILDKKTAVLKNAKGETKMDVAQSKVFKEISRIMMSSVLGTCVSDNRNFKVTLQGSGNNWQAVMTPKRKEMQQGLRNIIVSFDMTRALVSQVKITEKNGDTTLIVLKNIKTN